MVGLLLTVGGAGTGRTVVPDIDGNVDTVVPSLREKFLGRPQTPRARADDRQGHLGNLHGHEGTSPMVSATHSSL